MSGTSPIPPDTRWMGKSPPPHPTSLWCGSQAATTEMESVPTAHCAQGPLSWAHPTLSYQESGLPLSWVPYTDLLLASVEIEATVTLSIPLNCQLHLLECDCSPVQSGEAPAGHGALGPRSQSVLSLRQRHRPHKSITLSSVRQLTGSMQVLRDCLFYTHPMPATALGVCPASPLPDPRTQEAPQAGNEPPS